MPRMADVTSACQIDRVMRARSSNWIEQGTPKPKVASSILAGRISQSASVREAEGDAERPIEAVRNG